MANITLTKNETALVNAGRLQIAQFTPNGDFWKVLDAFATTSVWNSICNAYNTKEDLIDTTIAGGFTVTGTKEDGTAQPIGGEPNRPRPKPKNPQ